jgi:hypothetical protein
VEYNKYILKKAVLGKLKTRKDVEIYLNGLETEVSYFKCLKLLKSMRFKAEKKNLCLQPLTDQKG